VIIVKFAPQLKPVLKHETHDQSSHGSWAEGSKGATSILSDDEIRDVIYNSKTVNEMYQKVAKRLGKNMKPAVDNLAEDEITHYRGVVNVNRDAQRLLDGKIKFTEFQTWGQGIYLAEDKSIASNYGTLIGMKLDSSAKIVRGETTWDSAFDVSYDNPNARTRNTTTSSFIDFKRIETRIRAGKMDNLSVSDMRNIYWAAKGYDGFTTYGETVLFNGSKLTINKADIGTAVQKHATHDQSSHGNWASGLSADVAAKIIQFTQEWGGLSIKMTDGSMPTSGYMVAKPPEFGAVVDAADFADPVKGAKILGDYMKTHRKDLGSGKNYLGTWLNEGKVYLDVSENIQDVSAATKVGRERNQKAIWDVVNLQEIDTGGTGLVEKESQNGGVEKHSRDDRRRDRRIREADSRETHTVVIKFAPSLKPALKHAEHDQQSHGNWASGDGGKYSAYGARAAAIADREGAITTGDIEEMFSAAQNEITDSYSIDDDELREIVTNDVGLYEVYDEMVQQEMEAIADNEGIDINDIADFETTRDRAEQSALTTMRDSYDELIMETSGKSFDQNDAVEKMSNVFNYSDEKSGMYSEVTDVTFEYGNGLRVYGTVRDADNNDVGEFARTFIPDGNSFRVEHDIFRIYEEDAQGKGFGRGFIENQENAYVAAGLTRVNLYSAWDGAYTWSRGGYDFDPSRVGESIRSMNNASWYTSDLDDIAIAKLEDLRARSSSLDFSSPDFPMPHEYASLPNAKSVLFGQKVYFEKILTPEGFRIREGAIDADGDGMIFDGTPRERPAPPPSFFSQPALFDKP
jgi:hypothetical protein